MRNLPPSKSFVRVFATVVKVTYKEISASLSAGLVIGILALFLQASFAAMIFSGDLAEFLPEGMGVLLLGALIMGLIVTLMSTYASSIAMPQDSTAAIMGVVAAAIVATMSMENPSATFATVVAAMMLSSVFSGVALWLLGKFSLGRFVRYMPYPVIGGFLAGTGWILSSGGLTVMTDTVMGLDMLSVSSLTRWIPGFIFASLTLLLTRRYTHFLLMPFLLGSAVGIFYLVYFLINGEVDSAGANGWLLGPFPQQGLFQPVTMLALTEANWMVVFANGVSLATIFVVGAISFLLNATGLEIATRSNVELNRELKAIGVANVLAGSAGSSVGYHMLSLSTLGHRLNTNSRLIGLVSAAVIASALFFGASLLAIIPKLVAGGFLLFLGLAFLCDWLYDARPRLTKLDYLLIWLILSVIILFGMLQGVLVGILVSIILFVARYARTGNVRHTLSRRNFQSYVMRPPESERLLRQHGNELAIFELQGFIFFGSAHTLVDQLRNHIEGNANQLRFILLDFRLVTNIDSSASLSFLRLKQVLDKTDITLILTHLDSSVHDQLRESIVEYDNQLPVEFFDDLDQGVAWVEEQLLTMYADRDEDGVATAQHSPSFLTYFDQYFSDNGIQLVTHSISDGNKQSQRLLRFMDRLEAAAGTILLSEGEAVSNAYFIEQGQIIIYTDHDDGSRQQLRIQKAGTVFGEIGIYSGRLATATVATKDASILYSLSVENFSRMETEDPALAIAIHRLIALNLGRKLTQANYTIVALQK